MTLDVDDVGALATLHGLQTEGKVNILAVCYNEVNANSDKISFKTPKVSNPETMHIFLEVIDNGRPMLKIYQRIIVSVLP